MRLCTLALACLLAPLPLRAGEKNWTPLLGKDLSAFKSPQDNWEEVAAVEIDPANPRRLIAKPGAGIWYNGPKGNAKDLFTKEQFTDVEIQFEFLLPKGSNSGIKFQGVYEIQLKDSFGREKLTGDDCGGIYPRAELKPSYKHLDQGIAPKVNACKAPGEWQKLEAVFVAPRLDAAGKKTANAKLVKVVLNGQTIHENLELLHPTGHNWVRPEVASGPLMFQADHGPVALKNFQVRRR